MAIVLGAIGGIVGIMLLIWGLTVCCSNGSSGPVYTDANVIQPVPTISGHVQYGSAIVPTYTGDVITYDPYYPGPPTVEIVDVPVINYY